MYKEVTGVCCENRATHRATKRGQMQNFLTLQQAVDVVPAGLLKPKPLVCC